MPITDKNKVKDPAAGDPMGQENKGYYANMPMTDHHELNVSGGADVLGPVSERQLSREQLDQLRSPSQERLDQRAPGGPLPPRQSAPMMYQPRTRSQEELANLPQGGRIAYMPDQSRHTNSFV